ncbi:MAG: hypothetical protein BWY87_01575 [Deltaproteobacteria bacterium ADurb.Bin510]|nr:MAG: hypothetical protein BWY87_01575 [Deltaproteobacteria bacterium ADurb.Bin510]
MTEKLKLGVSACLLGQKVRYDGGHKLDHYIVDVLGRFVDFVPVCPEVEIGLGIPREPLRLVGEPNAARLVTSRSGLDHTATMRAWAAKRLNELEAEDLCGFIFKSGSPSSGMARVKVYASGGVPLKQGVGIFAQAFMRRFPLIPVEDEGRLNDLNLREHFIERIFGLKRWRDFERQPQSIGALMDFHARHKLLLNAHCETVQRQMGRLLAQAGKASCPATYSQYGQLYLQAMRHQTTVARHINVLQHMLGYFKRELAADEKAEILESLDHYRAGFVPLLVPLSLIRHYIRKYDQTYLKQQVYLNPSPLELKLRNHA